MNKNQKTMGNKGFSLVELIVVIAIMAVLVAVIAPQLLKYVEKGRQSTDVQTVESIASALQSYYADDETRTKDVTVTLEKTGVTPKDAAITDAKLDSAKLKGTWTKAPSVTLKADGTIAITGESAYYIYENNSPKKVTGSSSSSNE